MFSANRSGARQGLRVRGWASARVTVSLTAGAGLTAAMLVGGVSAAQAADPVMDQFLFTGEEETWTVPEGYDSVTIILAGGSGGTDVQGFPGGGGAVLSWSSLPVQPGQQCTLGVGQGGQIDEDAVISGSGGGAASYLDCDFDVAITAVAGGGGGGGATTGGEGGTLDGGFGGDILGSTGGEGATTTTDGDGGVPADDTKGGAGSPGFQGGGKGGSSQQAGCTPIATNSAGGQSPDPILKGGDGGDRCSFGRPGGGGGGGVFSGGGGAGYNTGGSTGGGGGSSSWTGVEPSIDAEVPSASRAPGRDGTVVFISTVTPGRQGAAFVPVEPYRVYDSRQGGGPLAGGQSRVVGTGVPEGAVAVAYNLTATGMTGSGFLAVSPGDAAAGGTSTLNYTGVGQTWANAFVSGVDGDGQVRVTAGGAATQFIVDVVGYYVPLTPPPTAAAAAAVAAAPGVGAAAAVGGWPSVGAGAGFESLFIPLVPTRAYDSRDIGAGGPLGAGAPRKVNVTAAGAVPAGATAVAYTLTQTGTTGTGFLTVGPAGQAQPDVSSINWFTANQTSANSSVVAVDEGFVDVWAGSSNGGSAQFVIDVLGYFLPVPEAPWAGAFTPIDPQRAYDSRVDQPAGPIAGGQGFTTSMAVEGVAEDAVAVAYNLTATGTTGSGFLTTVPGDVLSPPVASTINWWRPNQTLANGSVVDVPQFDRLVKAKGAQAQGTLGLPVTTFAGGGSTQYVIDVAGYYTFALN